MAQQKFKTSLTMEIFNKQLHERLFSTNPEEENKFQSEVSVNKSSGLEEVSESNIELFNLLFGKIFKHSTSQLEAKEIITKPAITFDSKSKVIGHDDDQYLNRHFYEGTFLKPEDWGPSISLDARIFHIDKETVGCDCLLDPEEMTFEKRIFPRQLFDHLFEPEIGRLVVIKIRTKNGSMRIDIMDGRGIVAPEKFELEEIWESLKDF